MKLQSYKDGGLADLTTFIFKEGLTLKTVLDSYRNRYQSLCRQTVPGRAFGHAWFPPEQPVRKLRIALVVSYKFGETSRRTNRQLETSVA